MSDRYRVTRSVGGGYTVRKTDLVDDVALGAANVAGSIIGASINGIGALARQSRDRRMSETVDQMVNMAQREDFDQLLKIATAFSQKYRQEPAGPALLSIALAGKGQYNDALAAVDRAVQLGLHPLEATDFRIGIYQRKGDTAKLLKEYSTLTQNSERHYDGYYGRAKVLIQIDDLDQALADANQVISLSPDEFGYCLRGDIYHAQGQLEKAIEDYTRAIRLEQNEALLFERRAAVYELLGKTDEARADREAIQHLGTMLRERNLERARKLLDDFQQNGIRVEAEPDGRLTVYWKKRNTRELEEAVRELKPYLLELIKK